MNFNFGAVNTHLVADGAVCRSCSDFMELLYFVGNYMLFVNIPFLSNSFRKFNNHFFHSPLQVAAK